jgi:hypothetical protein
VTIMTELQGRFRSKFHVKHGYCLTYRVTSVGSTWSLGWQNVTKWHPRRYTFVTFGPQNSVILFFCQRGRNTPSHAHNAFITDV